MSARVPCWTSDFGFSVAILVSHRKDGTFSLGKQQGGQRKSGQRWDGQLKGGQQ
jgi:hypothetical protein